MQITNSYRSPWHTEKPLVRGDDFHSSMAPSMHMDLYYILMKLNTNGSMNLCIYCQNAKISHCTQITKTLKCMSFLNTLSWSCILNKETSYSLFLINVFSYEKRLTPPIVHLSISYKLWYELTFLLSMFFH